MIPAADLIPFARGLHAAGHFTDAGDAIEFFASPHDYEPEHARWVALDRPDYSRETAAAWDVILDTLILSPEAEELFERGGVFAAGDRYSRAARNELVEAGLIEECEDAAECGARGVYELTAVGKVVAEMAR